MRSGRWRRSSARCRPAGSWPTPATFGELLDRWLEHVDDHLSPTTVREYRRLAAKLLHPELGSVPLRRLTTQRIDGYYRRLTHERGLSPASVRHVHAVLSGALGQAVRWGWLPVNPAATASLPRMRRREIQPPPISKTRSLLAAAEKHDPDFAALLTRASSRQAHGAVRRVGSGGATSTSRRAQRSSAGRSLRSLAVLS